MPSREQQDIHWIPGLLLVVVFLRPQVLENRLDLSKGGVGTPGDLWNPVEQRSERSEAAEAQTQTPRNFRRMFSSSIVSISISFSHASETPGHINKIGRFG